jgi:hypothetical protein
VLDPLLLSGLAGPAGQVERRPEVLVVIGHDALPRPVTSNVVAPRTAYCYRTTYEIVHRTSNSANFMIEFHDIA